MALKYVIKKTVFGFDKTKAVKYVARPLLAGTVDYSALCDQVTKVGMAPRGVVKMVTDGLIDAIMWNLENHLKSVRAVAKAAVQTVRKSNRHYSFSD